MTPGPAGVNTGGEGVSQFAYDRSHAVDPEVKEITIFTNCTN
jgi:hypothetical protein